MESSKEKEDEPKLIRLDKICRCCLLEKSDMKQIFDDYLLQMLLTCANLSISSTDGLPLLICFQCVIEVNRAYDFRQKCEKSEATLRNWFPNIEILNGDTAKYEIVNVLLEAYPNINTSTVIIPVDSSETIQFDESLILRQSTDENCDLDNSQKLIEIIHSDQTNLENENNPGIELGKEEHISESLGIEQDEIIDVQFLDEKMINDSFEEQYIDLLKADSNAEEESDEAKIITEKPNVENTLHKNNDDLTCDICQKVFLKKPQLNRHKRVHSTIKPYICQYCNKGFQEPGYLAKHVKRHTNDKKFMCNICGMSFYERNVLKIHIRIHTGEKPFVCSECGKAFAQNCQLDSHKKIHNAEKLHICNICYKAFTLPWQLKIHNRCHTEEKPYECPHCDKKFSQSGNLSIHIRIHTGEKPFVCTECNKGHVSKGELNAHMRKHTGEKPVMKATCPECGRKCTNNAELKIHLRVHTGEKPFVCSVCLKRFLLSSHLVVHMRSHSGEKPYPCGYCQKAFATGSMLKKHTFIHSKEKRIPRKKRKT